MRHGLGGPGGVRGVAAFIAALHCAIAGAECMPDRPGPDGPRTTIASLNTDVPRIDGDLDDGAWSGAACIVLRNQVFPVEGDAASEATEVRIIRGEQSIFLSVRAFDRDPAGIVATQLVRDADLYNDDHISFVLDPYGGRRDGYVFEVNALGARRDGLLYNGGQVRFEWDGLWSAAAKRDAGGWTAEIEIPLALLSFKSGLDEWGFNVERRIARSGEVMRWRTWDKDKEVYSLQDAGALDGMGKTESRQSLRIKATGVVRDSGGEAGDGTEFEPSADIFWRPSPEFTAVLTLNTDFAEADVDERIVNLSRFPVFLPEKRAFFLEDAGIFNFAGSVEDGALYTPTPFFSRRIGIDAEGRRVDLEAGAKVTGRAGPISFGFLGTRVDATATTPEKSLGVARLLAQVSDRAEVGVIATHGDPLRDATNTLVGTDFHFRDTNFADKGKILEAHAWFQESHSGEPDLTGQTYGLRIKYPNTGWIWNATAFQVDENFDPALGFVEQTGIRQTSGEFGYLMRPEGFNAITPQVDWNVRSRIDGGLEYRSINPEIYFENLRGDYIFPEVFFEHERLFESFEILPGIVVPSGSYDFTRYYLELGSSRDRAVYAGGYAIVGDYLTGTRDDIEAYAGWKPSAWFATSASYLINDIDLPEGRFIVRTVSFDMDVNFSTRLTTRLVLQHDNVSEDLGMSWRLRWIVGRDNDVFLVINRNWSTREDLQTVSRESVAKIAWNFLF